MKKIIILFVAALFVVSCKTEEPAPEVFAPGLGLPSFVLNTPQSEDAIYGVGISNSSNMNLAINTVKTRAVADIARQLSVRVESMLTDYAQEAGSGNNTQTIVFVESITKSVTDATLNGVQYVQLDQDAKGTYYALAKYPKANMNRDINDIFKRNEDAAFAEFKAQEALKRLDAELENNPVVPGGTY